MNLFRRLTCLLVSASIVYAPLADAAQKKKAQPQGYGSNVTLVKDFLQQSGWSTGKIKTYGELYETYRLNAPEELKAVFEPIILSMRDQPLPKVQAITIKNAYGQETVRLILTEENKQVTTIDYLAENPSRVLKYNGTVLSYQDLLSGNLGGKISGNDADKKVEKQVFKTEQAQSSMPSNKLFSKMSKYQRAVYLLELRKLHDAAFDVQQIFENKNKTAANDFNGKIDFVRMLINGGIAEAYEGYCVVAGYNGQYMGNRCAFNSVSFSRTEQNELPGYQGKVANKFSEYSKACKESGTFACNPLIYGFKPGGAAHCVSNEYLNGESQIATRACHEKSPLNDQKQVATFLKSLMDKGDGPTSIDKLFVAGTNKLKSQAALDELRATYVNPFDEYIQKMIDKCVEKAGSGEKNQTTACNALIERKANLHQWFKDLEVDKEITPIPTPIPTPTPTTVPPVTNKECTGDLVRDANNACVCPAGTMLENGNQCWYTCSSEGIRYRVGPGSGGSGGNSSGNNGGSSNTGDGPRGNGGAVVGSGSGGYGRPGVGGNSNGSASNNNRDYARASRERSNDRGNKGSKNGGWGSGSGSGSNNGSNHVNGGRRAGNGGGPSVDGVGCAPPPIICPTGYVDSNKPNKKLNGLYCEKDKCEGKKNGCWTCGCWLKPALIIGGIGLGIWAMLKLFKKKKHPRPDYIPPACDPTISQCNEVPVEPPVPPPPGPIEPTPVDPTPTPESEGGSGDPTYETGGAI